MQSLDGRGARNRPKSGNFGLWSWLFVTVVMLVIVLGIFRSGKNKTGLGPIATNQQLARNEAGARKIADHTPAAFRRHSIAPASSAQEIVAAKLKQFGASRRRLAHALADRHHIAVPDKVEQFFDAVESGNWEEISSRFDEINNGDKSATTHSDRPPEIQKLWPAIVDAFGVAEQVHLWPPQQLLDYGNSVMDALRPGMVYVGGTDNGRWVPELMNETSGDTPHIIVTQNALADDGYLDYVNLQYDGQLNTLSSDDSTKAFHDYLADYQARLAHDQQFPNEPAQIRPGESDGITTGTDGQLSIGGPNARIAVMSVNENLLNMLMDKNPGLSFALQESYPLKSTYAGAIPLGPLMELRAPDAQNTFSSDAAAQSRDYWNTAAQQILNDPATADSSATLISYAKDASAAANLLAAHNYPVEAEQVYRSAMQFTPLVSDAVSGYVDLLMGQNRSTEAIAVAEQAVQAAPDNKQLQSILNRVKNLKLK